MLSEAVQIRHMFFLSYRSLPKPTDRYRAVPGLFPIIKIEAHKKHRASERQTRVAVNSNYIIARNCEKIYPFCKISVYERKRKVANVKFAFRTADDRTD